jgi:nanoRNase/pAp phosphatase (c-di-AMP/oligoRNAs hydrolase)
MAIVTPVLGAGRGGGNGEASPVLGDPVALLRRFVEIARGCSRPLIHLQHNPDPDALGSGVGLQYLIKRLFDLDTPLAHTGQVGRSENRAMLRWLGIQIIPSYKVDYDAHDLLIVVDTHPGSGTCRLPPGIVPDVVVDHHPPIRPVEGVRLPFLATGFGATCTMVGWLLLGNGIPVSPRVATALAYGIRTDTQDLSRSSGPIDDEVFREIYALADKRILGRIERARLPPEYFVVLERGLRNAQVTDFAVTTYLGPVSHSDAVAEMSDILFRLEGMKWTLVAGHNGPLLYASVRAVRAEGIDAGRVAHLVSGGFGGGHDTFAGAQIPMPADGTPPEVVFERLRVAFLQAIGAKMSLTRPLTVPPEATK